MIYKEAIMLNPNLYQFTSSHKMTRVEVCLAASLGKQLRQDKGCLPSVLIVTCSVDLRGNGERSPGLTDGTLGQKPECPTPAFSPWLQTFETRWSFCSPFSLV